MDGGGTSLGAPDELAMPPAFNDVIGHHLRIAQDASSHASGQGAPDGRIKPGRFILPAILNDSPGPTPGAMSRIRGRDGSTLTGTPKGLAANGAAMLDCMRAHAARRDARPDAVVGADKPPLSGLLRRIAAEPRHDEPKPEREDAP